MNKKLIALSALVVSLALPIISLAAPFSPGGVPNQIVTTIPALVDILFGILWPIAVAFFIVMFVLAAFMFASAAGDPTKLQTARAYVIWGAVGVVVAVLAFSLPFVLRGQITGA